MGVRDRLAQIRKVFGNAVPPQIQAGEAAAGMGPTRPFSPGQPIGPYDGYSRTPRSRDFVTGYNIASRPRAHERVAFETLKGLVEAYDVAQMCIWHRIDSIRALDWSLVPARGFSGDADAAIDLGMQVLEKPDHETPFAAWLAKWLYDILAYDAGTLYRLRNRRGDVTGLAVVDGTTIAPLLDYWGGTPKAPAEAYVQYVQGVPWNWLTTDDLVYEPFRPRTNSPYGTAPLETILLNANTDLRFQAYFLQRFTEGNIPAAFASAPETWTPSQIEQFQEFWDAFMLGDQAVKSQVKWLPGGSKIEWSNEKDFSDKFSLHLMRKTAAAFHVVPADLGFTENVNKSSGETQGDVQHRVGDRPLVAHIQGVLTHFLQHDLVLPLQFSFDTGQEKEDRLQLAQAWQIYIESGMASPDEGREQLLGLPGDPRRPTPRFFSTTRLGPVPLLAIDGVAGKVDPETFGPAEDQPVLYQPFVPPPGVVPEEGTTDAKASQAAEDAYQVQRREQLETQDPPLPVTKDSEAATATAGITTDTGLTSYDLVGHHTEDDSDEEADEPDRKTEQAVKRELAAFRTFRKSRRRDGKWRDFEFRHVDPSVARQLNEDGELSVRKVVGSPKDKAPDKGADWPGWEHDERCADYWAPLISAATAGALTARQARVIVRGYRDSGHALGGQDRRTQVASVAAWLAAQGIDLATPVAGQLTGLYTDAYLIGVASALAAANGGPLQLGDWRPGQTSESRSRIEELGHALSLAILLDTVQEAARAIAGGRLNDMARVLIDGAAAGGSVEGVAASLRDTLADTDRSSAVAITEVTRGSSAAAVDTYLQRGVAMVRWRTEGDRKVCPRCTGNGAAGPVAIGQPFPSGDTAPPAHFRCRCAVQPA